MLESTRIVTSHRDTPGARTGGRSCCSGDDPVGATLIADDCGEIAIAELTGPDIGAPDRDELCVSAIIDKTRPHGPIGDRSQHRSSAMTAADPDSSLWSSCPPATERVALFVG